MVPDKVHLLSFIIQRSALLNILSCFLSWSTCMTFGKRVRCSLDDLIHQCLCSIPMGTAVIIFYIDIPAGWFLSSYSSRYIFPNKQCAGITNNRSVKYFNVLMVLLCLQNFYSSCKRFGYSVLVLQIAFNLNFSKNQHAFGRTNQNDHSLTD